MSVIAIVVIVSVFCNFMMTEKPSTPPKTVRETAMTKPRISARLLSIPPTRANTVPVAKVARETKTVSHPTKIKYDNAPGRMLPFTPKDARDNTIVGAFDLLPAKELMPTNRKEPKVPMKAASVACRNEIPKPKKKAP
jgi:hypothetical protein